MLIYSEATDTIVCHIYFRPPAAMAVILADHWDILISLSPNANGIITDVSYPCFYPTYVKYPGSPYHFYIMIETVTSEISLHDHT